MLPLSIMRVEAEGATVWLSVNGANAAPSFLVTPVIRGYAISALINVKYSSRTHHFGNASLNQPLRIVGKDRNVVSNRTPYASRHGSAAFAFDIILDG
jgi:hypothetical protein